METYEGPTNQDLPVTVVAQVSLDCASEYAETPARHRIWIHRDGSVSTPDHNITAEDTFTALGGILEHPCAYWLGASKSTDVTALGAAPVIRSWAIDQVAAAWTTKSMWTFHQALAGEVWVDRLDPARSLEYVQAYAQHGDVPLDLRRHLAILDDPTTRAGGSRRGRPTTPQEVKELLNAVVPSHLVADFAACDFSADSAREAIERAARIGLRPDIAIYLATLFSPTEVVDLLSRITPEEARYLPQRLTQALQQDTMNRRQACQYLLSGLLG